MNKNAIKKFATEARRELISRVGQRALKYGISDKEVGNPNDDSVGGHLLSSTEKKQRAALIEQIKEKGYEQVMEEVAYTWFNRFSALRFMEVNGYLPTRVRVFTDENNAFKPQILTEAIHMELDGLDMEKVYAYKEANDNDELYKYLLITQCNALNSVLPGMFQKIADYTELLFPDNLLREGSVVQQMIELIPEEDWKDAVQIIGWLYQYYNSDLKAAVDIEIKNGGKANKNTMPAKTQIFTPDWIVRYMVENALGNLWTEAGNSQVSKWKYYISDGVKSGEAINPENLRCLDPCAGSGHILCYFFDVLIDIYESYGFPTRDAVNSIVEKNIWGIDVDERAAQLAYFAIMMKAVQYDSRFLRRRNIPQPHIFAIKESNEIDKALVEYFINNDSVIKENILALFAKLQDAKIYGSIIDTKGIDYKLLYRRFDEISEDINIYSYAANDVLLPLVKASEVLSQRYDVMVTNPPYLALGDMPDSLAERVKIEYPDSKWDMFSVFVDRACSLVKKNGFYALITQPSIITLSSFEKLRKKINSLQSMQSLIHMGRGIFGVDFGSTAFVVKNKMPDNTLVAKFYRLHEKTFQYIEPEDIEKIFMEVLSKPETLCDFSKYDTKVGVTSELFLGDNGRKLFFEINPLVFNNVPSAPWIYEASETLIEAFAGNTLKDLATPKVGLQTGDNNRFTRLWFEVPMSEIMFGAESRDEAANSGYKWFPYNKGGDYRKWYGNDDYVVNWENDGSEIRNFTNDKGKLKSRPQNLDYYFKKAVSWSKISAGSISFRLKDNGFIFDVAGTSFFTNEELMYYMAGFCNSSVALKIAKMISPTMNYEVGHIASFPIIIDRSYIPRITDLVKEAVAISKSDWDSFENSWDFKRHPLIPAGKKPALLQECFDEWNRETHQRFYRLKEIECEISGIFEIVYSLEGDSAALDDSAISIRLADKQRDIKGLISYAVGCMFGRYSLNKEGVVFSGGEWNLDKYVDFPVDKDNIIPICSEEYFNDDITNVFIRFIETVYGKEYLEENLRFIADALEGNGSAREVIRDYFLKDFYADHCANCSVGISGKRPIYWMFDSGKKNGFKCLIYMHRYQPDTIARIRTDYVHEQQARYRTAIADLETRITNASTSERVKLNKQLKTLNDQATEIHAYEEKIHHLADQMISIDLDDGVKKNYKIFKDVLAKIK